MTSLDLYREKYERRGGTAEQFLEAHRHAGPEKVVDYLLEHLPEGVRGALIVTVMTFRDTCRTHRNALVALLQQDRTAMTYDRLAADLPEPPELCAGVETNDVDWTIDRLDLLNRVK